MSILVATHLVLLAQDDTGYAPRWAILLGTLAFPCLVFIYIVWCKLKDAKENEKLVENQQKMIGKLENELDQKQNDEWESEMERESKTAAPAKPLVILPINPASVGRPSRIAHVDDGESVFEYEKIRDSLVHQGKPLEEAKQEAAAIWWRRHPGVKNPFKDNMEKIRDYRFKRGADQGEGTAELKRQFRIVHIDDEDWLLEMMARTIRANQAFQNVTVQTFQNRDNAWAELLRKDPDLLITDLRSDNVPGRNEYFGMSGCEMLFLLAQKQVKYPILVFSGSLSIEEWEIKARQSAGSNLDVCFLKKPVTSEQFYSVLSKYTKYIKV